MALIVIGSCRVVKERRGACHISNEKSPGLTRVIEKVDDLDSYMSGGSEKVNGGEGN